MSLTFSPAPYGGTPTYGGAMPSVGPIPTYGSLPTYGAVPRTNGGSLVVSPQYATAPRQYAAPPMTYTSAPPPTPVMRSEIATSGIGYAMPAPVQYAAPPVQVALPIAVPTRPVLAPAPVMELAIPTRSLPVMERALPMRSTPIMERERVVSERPISKEELASTGNLVESRNEGRYREAFDYDRGFDSSYRGRPVSLERSPYVDRAYPLDRSYGRSYPLDRAYPTMERAASYDRMPTSYPGGSQRYVPTVPATIGSSLDPYGARGLSGSRQFPLIA